MLSLYFQQCNLTREVFLPGKSTRHRQNLSEKKEPETSILVTKKTVLNQYFLTPPFSHQSADIHNSLPVEGLKNSDSDQTITLSD